GNTVSFQYDHDDQVTQAGALALTYDPGNGLLTGTALAGAAGVADVLGYNAFGERASYQVSANGSSLLQQSDTLDALGRLSQRVETVGGTSHTYGYGYDALGRLTQLTQDGT